MDLRKPPELIEPQNTASAPQPPEPLEPMASQDPIDAMPDSIAMPPSSGGGASKIWIIIAILAILALIGVGAYAYMQMSSKKSEVSDLNAELATSKEQVATLQSAAEATTILKISEFGVQMPKPTDAKEIFYYVPNTVASTTTPATTTPAVTTTATTATTAAAVTASVAYFSSPALQSLSAINPSTPAVLNSCGLNSSPLGTITKYEAGSLVKGVKIEEVKDTDVLIVKKQDVAYYVYNAPATQCSTVKIVQELQAKQAKSLQEAFKNITASK
jgi:Tfp pilus assembly protein PilE